MVEKNSLEPLKHNQATATKPIKAKASKTSKNMQKSTNLCEAQLKLYMPNPIARQLQDLKGL